MTPELGTCYYPEHWPEDIWPEDARRMREAGLSWVRIGEFAWSRIEPSPGHFNWGWLDRAVEVLAAAGLKIVMGTPSATPPKWLVDTMPDMLAVDEAGRERRFGSRRHYCFSHEGYRAEAVRIARAMGERYARHPAVAAWQVDNEYGCHDTALSCSPAALAGFRVWLRRRYGGIDALNRHWGTVFWSMEYRDFDEIELPNLTVTEAAPAHRLDFQRYTSDQVAAFNRAQAEALRALGAADLAHNYMGAIVAFDHRAVAAPLDIASWDSYPLGFLEDRVPCDDDHRAVYMRYGDPDFQAFHHDLYRGMGRLWIMEQQPGPVNWAPYNPAPAAGAVRLWSWEAIAHGAEVVSYFRWRQAPFAQEQMHAGLLRPDSAPAPGLGEAQTVAREIAATGPVETARADVALVFDYESAWAWRIQPQGRGFDYLDLVFDAYRGLRRLGLSVDIIGPEEASWQAWPMVAAPGVMAWTDAMRAALSAYRGVAVLGPRAGSKTATFAIPACLPPDLGDLLDARVTHAETLRPGALVPVRGGGAFRLWREAVEAGAEVLLEDENGAPALVRQGAIRYLCGWPDAALWARVLRRAAVSAGLEPRDLPGGLRLRRAGSRLFAYNYGPGTADLSNLGDGWGLDGPRLPPGGVAFKEITA